MQFYGSVDICKVYATHHKRSSTGHRLGVIPSKHAFSERFKIVEGSSGSRAIVEVVILATVVEVAVHAEVVELDGSVTRVFGDGSGSSGTCFEEELDESDFPDGRE